MKKSRIIVVVLIELLFMVGFVFVGCDFAEVECPSYKDCIVGYSNPNPGRDCGETTCAVYDAERRRKSASDYDRSTTCDCL